MQQIDFNQFKVRCSKISTALSDSRSNPTITEKQKIRLTELSQKKENGTITEKQELELVELIVKDKNSDKIILSDDFISYLCEEYSYLTTGKICIDKEFISLEQMEKGKIVEIDAVATLCFADGIIYNYNDKKERIANDYLTGEVDVYSGENIMDSDCIIDIKSIWDYPTYLKKIKKPLSLSNKYQVQGYLEISGATHGYIANVLINTPPIVIEAIKWKLLNKLSATTEESPEFKEAWQVVYRSMIFDDIPIKQRVNKIYVERFDEFTRNKLYDRVKYARDYLFKLDEEQKNIK